jgi:hypothetical protein
MQVQEACRPVQGEFRQEDRMLIQFSMIVLTSQLVIAVADGVPQFNIERGCKVDSASAFDPNAGMSATIKRCGDDEQRAKGQLETQWSGFVASDRAMCTGAVRATRSRRATSIC